MGAPTYAGVARADEGESVKRLADCVFSEPVSVVILKKNGRFQEERTYPRSADPRKSKG